MFIESNKHVLLTALEKIMAEYLRDVKISVAKPDKR